ncbi:hypothetical protein BASA60_011275 [Batrachochytrium salamandrivorans]|nr:hypothetical protein BASA60_011275 [Batrachochytrium salamandrivorans]
MRVGIGIILSVLSFSVLAAVIPNYDSHSPLLVRRAGSPNSNAVLWKRNNEEQTPPVPSSSGAGASAQTSTSNGESNPDYSSGNRGSGILDRFRAFLESFYKIFKKLRSTPKQKYLQWRDDGSIKKVVKTLTEVTEGEQAKQVVLEIKRFLNITLKGARMTFDLFDDKDATPFFLPIPKDSNQKSLIKKMVTIQKSGKKAAKEHLGDVTRGIDGVIKNPQYVVKEMEKITDSISRMCMALTPMYNRDFTDLVAKVNPTNKEKYTKNIKNHVSEMWGYRDGAMVSFNAIKNHISSGRVTFKGKNSSKFSNFKSGVQKRLGIKKKSSTGVPPNPESPYQDTPGQDTSYQDTPGQQASNQDTPGQQASNQDTPGQQASDQGESDEDESGPIPAKRRRMMVGLKTWV